MNAGRRIYIIGSLSNPRVPAVARDLRKQGHEVFDDWYAAGPSADKIWRDYEKQRGRSMVEALSEKNAIKNFGFDLENIHWADTGVLILPCGKSGHLELGYMIGKGKRGLILAEGEPENWDLMYRFAHGVYYCMNDLTAALER